MIRFAAGVYRGTAMVSFCSCGTGIAHFGPRCEKLEGSDEGLFGPFRGDLVAFTSLTVLLELASPAI